MTILKIIRDCLDRGMDDEEVLREVLRQRPLALTGLSYVGRVRRIMANKGGG